jgi:hypothetical protein
MAETSKRNTIASTRVATAHQDERKHVAAMRILEHLERNPDAYFELISELTPKTKLDRSQRRRKRHDDDYRNHQAA